MRTPLFDLEFRVRTVRLAPEAFAVSVAGELDLHTLPQLRTALTALDDRSATRVIVDLTDAVFVDSTALGALVAEARTLRGRGGELFLVADDRRVHRVLEVTGIGSQFALRRSLREAVQDALGSVAE